MHNGGLWNASQLSYPRSPKHSDAERETVREKLSCTVRYDAVLRLSARAGALKDRPQSIDVLWHVHDTSER